MQSRLETAWRAWQSLSRIEKAQFLGLFREQYARERQRATMARKNGHAGHGARISSLTDLRLSEADLQRSGP
ncbi:hypothetical protein ACVWXO_005023 [Bradyrhizobium sp. LM2.7]